MHAKLKLVGIHAMVVEPGFFRTNFLDSGSMIATKTRISDYAETVCQMREFTGGHSVQQPGDPAKLAQALLTLASTDQPPLRLVSGGDTVARMAQKYAAVAQQIEPWKTLSNPLRAVIRRIGPLKLRPVLSNPYQRTEGSNRRIGVITDCI